MRRFLALALAVAIVGLGVPAPVFAAGNPINGEVNGVVKTLDRGPVSGYTSRLRSMTTGYVSGSTTTNSSGKFSFTNVANGTYLVEVLNMTGAVVGTSSMVTVSSTKPVVNDVAVVVPGDDDSKKSGAAFLTSTEGIVLMAAIAAGVTTGVIIQAKKDKSKKK